MKMMDAIEGVVIAHCHNHTSIIEMRKAIEALVDVQNEDLEAALLHKGQESQAWRGATAALSKEVVRLLSK